MKTLTTLTLTTLTAVLLSAGSALADNSGFYSADNHRGVVASSPSQPKATVSVAFGGSVKTSKAAQPSGRRTLKQINTAHGTVTYFTE